MASTSFSAAQAIATGNSLNENQKQTIYRENRAPGLEITRGKLLYSEVEILAPAAKIWAVLMDFERYPEWNPFIVSIKGLPHVGKRIQAHIVPPGEKGMHFTPRVLVNQPEKEFRWLGSVGIPYLFDGEHSFTLEEHPDGHCTFRHFERFRGLLVPFFTKMLDGPSLSGFQLMNQRLKERAEK